MEVICSIPTLVHGIWCRLDTSICRFESGQTSFKQHQFQQLAGLPIDHRPWNPDAMVLQRPVPPGCKLAIEKLEVWKKLKNNEKHVVNSEETKLGPGAWGVPSTSSMESISCEALLKKRYTEQRRHGKPCKPCSKPRCESKPEACWLILQVVCFYWHLSTVLTSCECFLEVLNSESINSSFYLPSFVSTNNRKCWFFFLLSPTCKTHSKCPNPWCCAYLKLKELWPPLGFLSSWFAET